MCVFTPLVIPVPMVSVALERRVISSFWGVAHWNPWGRRGGERKTSKGEGWEHCLRELLFVLKLVHYFAAARTCNGVHLQLCILFYSVTLPVPCLCLPPSVHALLFSVCFILSRALITNAGFCSPWVSDYKVILSDPLCCLPLFPQSMFVGDWLTESIRALTVFGIYQVHLHIFNCNHASAVVCFWSHCV